MKRYSIEHNALRCGYDGTWIVKSRVIGMFSMKIARIHKLYKKLLSTEKLIDACGRHASKTLILLDNEQAVLSPFEVGTLAKYFDPNVSEKDDG